MVLTAPYAELVVRCEKRTLLAAAACASLCLAHALLSMACTPPATGTGRSVMAVESARAPSDAGTTPGSSRSAAPARAPTSRSTARASAPARPAPPPEPARPSVVHRVAVQLRPGGARCTLAFDSEFFEDYHDWLTIGQVRRVTSEASPGCADGVLYDVTTELKLRPDDPDPSPLWVGMVVLPGHHLPPEETASFPNVLEDLNFDGYVDLCLVEYSGAYNYSQKCWLFDPKARKFVRHPELSEVLFPKVDRSKQRLSSSIREGGPIYSRSEWKWRDGKLVKTQQIVTTFGEKPDGSPLPAGFECWVVRSELRGDALVKLSEGPEHERPADRSPSQPTSGRASDVTP